MHQISIMLPNSFVNFTNDKKELTFYTDETGNLFIEEEATDKLIAVYAAGNWLSCIDSSVFEIQNDSKLRVLIRPYQK